MSFDLEKKQQIITLFNLLPTDLPLVTAKTEALEAFDLTNGTEFVEQAQKWIQELIEGIELPTNIKSVAVDQEVTVAYIEGAKTVAQTKKESLARLLSLPLRTQTFNNPIASQTLNNRVCY